MKEQNKESSFLDKIVILLFRFLNSLVYKLQFKIIIATLMNKLFYKFNQD